MAQIKEDCEKFATCFRVKKRLLVGFFIIVGLIMAVMLVPFALPLQLFNDQWVPKSGKIIRIYIQRLPNCNYNYLSHLGNSLQRFIIAIHISSS